MSYWRRGDGGRAYKRAVIDVQFRRDRGVIVQRKIDTSEFDLMCRVRPLEPPTRRLASEHPPRPGAVEAKKLRDDDDYRLSCWRQDRLRGYELDE